MLVHWCPMAIIIRNKLHVIFNCRLNLFLWFVIVQQNEIQLEEVKIQECASDVPTPMEHKLIERLWLQYLQQKQLPLLLWNNMENLVEHPNHLWCSKAVVQLKKHPNCFEQEPIVKIWRDQHFIPVDFSKPSGNEVKRPIYGLLIVCSCLTQYNSNKLI